MPDAEIRQNAFNRCPRSIPGRITANGWREMTSPCCKIISGSNTHNVEGLSPQQTRNTSRYGSSAEDRDVGLKREDAIKNSKKKEEKNRGGLKLAALPRMNEPCRDRWSRIEHLQDADLSRHEAGETFKVHVDVAKEKERQEKGQRHGSGKPEPECLSRQFHSKSVLRRKQKQIRQKEMHRKSMKQIHTKWNHQFVRLVQARPRLC